MTPIQNLADNLAALGRYEDTYMVHAAEGETVVPRDVLDANPILKTALFAQMRSMGIENPDRYVVGSGLNSVNPITGQPEFFFKKIKRLVKKIAAPVAGTIGFAIAGPAGAAIGSGLGSLVGGASPKQALTNAAIGGFLGYGAGKFAPNLQGQLQGAFRGIPGIGGLMPAQAVPAYVPASPGGGLVNAAKAAQAQAQGAQAGTLAKIGAWAKKNPPLAAGLAGAGVLAISSLMSGSGAEEEEFTEPLRYQDYLRERNALGDNATPDQVRQLRISYGLSPTPPTPMEGLQPGYGMADGGNPIAEMSIGEQAALVNDLNMRISEIVAAMAKPGADIPSLLEAKRMQERQIDAILGAGSQPYTPNDGEVVQEEVIVEANRGGGLSQLRDQMVAMQGFPRRNGAISGPGGPRDDLIPAMLSDGEFVMNERAVRGAGGGNLALGTRRMYDLMNRFEGAAS
jgi:hypothetical protein